MDKKLKEALALISEKCKETSYSEYREKLLSQKLDKLIWNLKSEFQIVDSITINYLKTQENKKSPGRYDDDEYTPTELTKGEKERALEVLQYFKNDIEYCINHLNNH